MNPILFGAGERPLFGVYLPPKAKRARPSGVVLCYPMGQEYMRAHRAFRQLALLLQKAGFHVLRFDYYGTGDSGGDSDAGSLDQWTADVATAMDELRATAEVPRVSLVGLRLGALLAARAAEPREDVECVVLWDPVVTGGPYVAELLGSRVGARESAGAAAVTRDDGGPIGIMGFPLTPALRSDLEAANLLAVGAQPGCKRLVVVSQARAEYEQAGRYRPPAGGPVRFEVVPSEGSWNEVDDYGGALIPQRLIQRIVAYLVEETGS